MEKAAQRKDEASAMAALRALEVLDSGAEEEFDALVRAASLACDVPISLISLIDVERQWFKANVGLPGVEETPRDVAFCAHAVLDDQLFEVPDAMADLRFADNPLVTGQPDIRFYAGMPLRLRGGERVGTLCVIDRKPRQLSDTQRETLRQLSIAAARALEGRVALRQMHLTARLHARAALVLEHSTDAVIGVAPDGRIERWNATAERMFGYSAEAAIGKPMGMLVPSFERARDAMAGASAVQGADVNYESVRQHRDGRLIDVSVTMVPEFDAAGARIGTTKFVRDISARKHAQRQLAESASSLRLVTDHIPSMVALWNRDLTCRFANPAYGAWVGRAAEDLTGRPLQELLGPALFAETRPYIDAVLRGETQHFERRFTGADGTPRHALAAYVPHRVNGELAGFLAQISDVTALKQTEQALRSEVQERERANRALHDTTDALQEAQRLGRIGSWQWDIATDHSTWSPELYRMAGLAPDRLPPPFAERARLYTRESWARLRDAVDRAVRLREPYCIEVQIVGDDGAQRWMETRGEPLVGGDGQVHGLRGTAQDISERKRAEADLRHSQDFLARTGALAGVGGWEVALASGEIRWSDEVCRIHGRPAGHRPTMEEALGYYCAESRPRIEAAVQAAMAGGAPFDLELRIRAHDGAVRWIRTMGAVEFEDGAPVRLAGAFQDVTERHGLVEELHSQHELLRVTLQSIGDAVITTDKDGSITWLNPVAERLTGWLNAEAVGRQLDQVFHIVDETTRRLAENPILACIRADKVMGLAPDTVLISRTGQEFGVQDSASPIRDDHGQMLGAVLVFHDVTEQRRISGEMSYRAKHDALTGLVNRLEFETQLQQLLDKSRHNGTGHALMFVDLDQFKLVNDACGHAAGDLLLQQVARLLEEAVRGRDTLARLGGDEFGILLERCSTEQAMRVAQQVCDRMDEFRFLHDGRRFRIGTSIGLVPVDARWHSTTAVMQAADTSCYAAKEAGRNRVHAWFDTDAVMHARTGDMKWATRLEQAIDEDRFVLYAQRIFPLTGDTSKHSMEVLVRLREHDGSLVLPGAFLPAAERFNLATRIDHWVLRHAIAALQAHPDLDRIGCLCINLSGQSVGDRAFHRKAFGLLEQAGRAVCDKVFIEITETAAITNMADATRFIEQAHALGIGIALDDFGAGASSFGYLKSLKADKLKIDGQFVRDVLDDPLDHAAVRCFVDVARVVHMKTVAEFVDSEAVLQCIREMGVDYAQGFHLHRPEPLEAVFGRMQSHPA